HGRRAPSSRTEGTCAPQGRVVRPASPGGPDCRVPSWPATYRPGMRATRRGDPDPAARLRALTRRAYTASAGHLDLDDDVGREFDRIVHGEGVPGRGDGAGRRGPPARRWAVSGRAVVVVLAVVAALAGAVVARALALGPSDAVPVPSLAEPNAPASEASVSEPPAPTPTAGSPGQGATEEAGPTGDVRAGGPQAAADDGAAPVVVVHVAGAVVAAGVVTLPAGARVADAVEAVGGALPEAELAAVNLARPLVDGEQVYVPRVGEAPPGPAAGAGPAPPAGASAPGGP